MDAEDELATAVAGPEDWQRDGRAAVYARRRGDGPRPADGRSDPP